MKNILRLALPGFMAILLGHGVGRFAFTPLIPTLIGAGWTSAAEAAYLGAANLAGYLIGAGVALKLAGRAGVARTLWFAIALVVLGTAAGALPFGFWFWLPWRVGTGIAGALIIILAASSTLARCPPDRRGKVAGVMFGGMGIGIMLSGSLVPALAGWGPAMAWGGLLLLGLLALPFAVRGWPRDPAAPPPPMRWTPVLLLVALAYAGDAIAFIPHTVFLVDYVARGLGYGLAQGGTVWVAFGIGAMLGPLAVGPLADRLGFPACFAGALAVKGLAVALLLSSDALPALWVSAGLIGALTPGVAMLGSGTALALAGLAGHAAAWRSLTLIFATAQGLAGWGFSRWFAETGTYRGLFWVALTVFALSTLSAGAAAFMAGRAGRIRAG